MSKLSNKKTIVLVFIALIIVLIAPKPASATVPVVPVFETNPVLVGKQTGLQLITSGATWATKLQQFFEWMFKVAAEALKRQLLNMIVDQIVQWIQGGGKPKFITNWPAFFQDAVDQAGGKFLQTAIGPQICSPFKPLLRAAFIPIATFTERTTCTLSQIGVNIDEFLKDFRKGNWIAWQEMVLRPQNNVYGAYVMAWDQYAIERGAAAKAGASEAQAGKGFLSVKRCVANDQEALRKCTADCYSLFPDLTQRDSCNQNCFKQTCTKEETVTPGAVVGDLAAKAVGSDIDWLVNAQDLAAYVAAITNALLNRMFAEGIGLLHTASSSGGGGGGGSSAQNQCAQLLGTAAYNDCITSIQGGADIREFQKNYMISSINQELDYQNQLSGAKQATLIVLNQSIDILYQLNNCQGTTTLVLAKIQQVQNVASTTASQIIQIQSDIIALQLKQQEIQAVTDLSQIPSFYNQVNGIVNSSITQSLALAAQSETSQKTQDMSLYQQQLSACQAAAAAAAASGGGP